jgi:hypothetical protein
MTITLDKVLGGTAGGSGTSLGFNTTQAIAAGARVSVCVGNWGMGTGAQANSVTASGLTFHLDESEASTTPQARGTMWLSEPDATGHASGLTITAGWASSVDATTICAASFLGLDTGASGYAAATPPTTVSEAGTTDWATGTVTPPAGDVLLVAMVNMDGVTTDTVTTTAPATEAQTFASATTTEGISQSYRIVTADGSTAYSIAGTFSSAPGEQTYHLVAYKASAGAAVSPAPHPHRMPLGV